MKVWLSFLCFLIFISASGQRSMTISGKVIDQETGLPIPAVAVIIHETGTGNYTDIGGAFVIDKIKRGFYHLHFDCIGYKSQYLDIKLDTSDLYLSIQMQPTILELKQIVLEGEYLKTQKENIPLQVETISGTSLQSSQENTFSDALQRIPGINSINTGVGVAKPVIRGMSGNRIVVNENGINQEGQQWGSDHGLEIDISEVAQVEVVKGPASILYGSDGLGGVINIKPWGAPAANTMSGMFKTFYKSNNQNIGLSGNIGFRELNNWYRISFSMQDYGDYRVPADSFNYLNFKLPIYNNKLKNTAGEIQNYSVSAGTLRPWGKMQLRASNYHQKAGFFAGAIGIPGSYVLRDDGNSRNIDLPYQEVNHNKVVYTAEIFLHKNWMEIDAGFQQNLRQEYSQAHSHGPVAVDNGSNLAHKFDLRTTTLKLQYHFTVLDSLKMICGINNELQHNIIQGFEFLIPKYTTRQHGVFSYASYALLSNMNISGGIRYDLAYYNISAHQPNTYASFVPSSNRQYGNWSSALGLSYFPFGKNINVKFNVGKTYRLPTIPEITMNGVHHGTSRHEMGDLSLDPENGYQFDFSVQYTRKDFLFKVAPFYNNYSNYIYLRPIVQFSPLPDGGQIYQYTQSKAAYYGSEVTLEWHPIQSLHFQTGGEYVRAYNSETNIDLPFIPPLAIKNELEWSFDKNFGFIEKPYLGLDYNITFAQNKVDRNEATTKGYNLLDLFCGSNMKIGKENFKLLVRVNNLFNKKYLKHISSYRILNLPEQGRNFMISLSYNVDRKVKKEIQSK
jgi:iron complex outermembrane receptor protein